MTWESYEHSGFDNFYTGNYFPTHQSVRIDFYKRAAHAWEHYVPAKKKNRPPEKPLSR